MQTIQIYSRSALQPSYICTLVGTRRSILIFYGFELERIKRLLMKFVCMVYFQECPFVIDTCSNNIRELEFCSLDSSSFTLHHKILVRIIIQEMP